MRAIRFTQSRKKDTKIHLYDGRASLLTFCGQYIGAAWTTYFPRTEHEKLVFEGKAEHYDMYCERCLKKYWRKKKVEGQQI